MDDRVDAGGRPAPGVGVGDVARDRLGAELRNHGARGLADQGTDVLAGRAERLDHVTAHEAARAGDEDRHAGSSETEAKGSSPTRASTPATRTTVPGSTSRRRTPSPIQRPGPSGSHAMLVTRPTSRSR